MSEVPFHLTLMGRRYYEATLPALVEAIEQLNRNLERLGAPVVLPANAGSPPPAAAPGAPPAGRPDAGGR